MIAFDSSDHSAIASYSFTNTAGNFMIVGVNSDSATPPTVSYNSVGMTFVLTQKIDTDNAWLHMFVLHSPATGSNTLAVVGTFSQLIVVTYSGVKDTGQPEVTTQKAQSSASSVSNTITTISDGSWVVAIWLAYGVPTEFTDVTRRATDGNYPYVGDSDGVVTPAGDLLQSVGYGGTSPWAFIQLALAPEVSPPEHPKYPSSIYDPRTKENKPGVVYNEDKKTVGYAEDVVWLDKEVVAIEEELGIKPKGSSASVLERIKGIKSLAGADADVIIIDEDNVGIGVPDPLVKLEVAGAIASGVKTVSGVGPHDDVDVSGVNTVFMDCTSSGVIIGAFIGGVEGQILYVSRSCDSAWVATLEHNEGTINQNIFLHAGHNESLGDEFGGWTLVCDGSRWLDLSHAKHV